MQPLLITVKLVNRLANNPPTFDAILADATADPLIVERLQHARLARDFTTYNPLPLGIVDIDGWSIFRASSAILSPVLCESVGYVNRKLDPLNFGLVDYKKLRKLNTSGGFDKSWHIPVRERLIEKIAWFAFGDKAEIEKILKGVRHIGGLRKIGYGRVAKNGWKVEVIDHDLSWIAYTEENKPVLMRPLPDAILKSLPNLTGYKSSYSSVSNPYWHADRFTKAVSPC